MGIIKMQPIPNTIVSHNTSSPDAVKMTSRCVPSMLRQAQRIQAVTTQAQPIMVMKDTYNSTCQPT